MDNVRTSAIELTPFITHSIFVQALPQVSWTFIVVITLLASRRAPLADEISAVGSAAVASSADRLSTSVGTEGSALIVKEDESAANEIVKLRVTD